MSSFTEQATAEGSSASRNRAGAFSRWNRKLHYYLGLYLLFFVWLFALTGLLLNHSQWKFAEFWDSRQETTVERDIVAPPSEGDLAQARDLMGQLGIRGEIDWTVTRNTPGLLEFRASRPGHIFEIKADLAGRKARIKGIELNAWGVMHILHTFTGERRDDDRNQRDWIVTSVWALSMDAVALGLIVMVISSLFMWYELPRKRTTGAIVLSLGFLTSGLLCVGLRFLF